MSVKTYWPWGTTATLRCARRREALRRPQREERGGGISWRLQLVWRWLVVVVVSVRRQDELTTTDRFAADCDDQRLPGAVHYMSRDRHQHSVLDWDRIRLRPRPARIISAARSVDSVFQQLPTPPRETSWPLWRLSLALLAILRQHTWLAHTTSVILNSLQLACLILTLWSSQGWYKPRVFKTF